MPTDLEIAANTIAQWSPLKCCKEDLFLADLEEGVVVVRCQICGSHLVSMGLNEYKSLVGENCEPAHS